MLEKGTGEPESDLIQVRMINEYAFCPRLYHLERVEGWWADNAFTEDGKRVHRKVDQLDHVLPDPDAEPADPEKDANAPTITRSVTLGSERLGIVGKLDLVSTADDEAVPVERKRGKPPANEERCYEPERVQLMAQGLLLREHGYRCDHGVLYFAESRQRVDVPFSPALEARTFQLIEAAQWQARSRIIPQPLRDDPRCGGCSLSGICLPDETLALQEAPPDQTAPEVRRLYPARDDSRPLYISEQGAVVGTEQGRLLIRKSGQKIAESRLADLDQLVLLGNISISAQALHVLCEAGIPVIHCSTGHWFYGITVGMGLRNSYDRAAQFDAASQPAWRLRLAKSFVVGKIANQRTILRRNAAPVPEETLSALSGSLGALEQVGDLEELRGVEGAAARSYFERFGAMLRPQEGSLAFDMEGRNRRPPRDPVNSMLSFGYALLAKECTIGLLGVGLDPHWGFLHAPRHGRPALALDLMEEFRPLIVDSAVITAVNTGMVRERDFTRGRSGCILSANGRKAFIRAFEARMEQLVTHPVFHYRASWRSMIRLQARFLARNLRGDIPAYRAITTR